MLGDFDVSLDLQARTTQLAVTAGATLIGGRDAYLPPEVKPPLLEPATKAADMFATGVLFKWLADSVDGLGTVELAKLNEALTADEPTARPTALEAQVHAFFTTEGVARHAALEAEQAAFDAEQAAFANSVTVMALRQCEHDKATQALVNKQDALVAERVELAQEQESIRKLRASSVREDADVRGRAEAAATAESRLLAEAQRIAADARATEALRQQVEADRKQIVKLHPRVPAYWEHKDLSKLHFELVTTRFMTRRLQGLLRSTAFGGCGGCGTKLANATVTRVLRVENTILWKNYGHRKATMLELTRGGRPQTTPVPHHQSLDPDANEVFLFHGTNPDVAKTIAKHGFDERIAALTGLYGGGCYFAENSCKSNQYARATTAAGEQVMLYCRVLLGDAHRTNQNLQNQRRAPNHCDSVVASGGTQVHREFIVYDRHQVYPEFIIYYKR